MKTQSNPTPLIAEVDINLSEAEEHIDCLCTLRINEDEFEFSDKLYQLSIRRAFLKLDLEGMQVLEGSRYGEPTSSNVITCDANIDRTKQSGFEAVSSAGAQLKADTSGPNIPSASIDISSGASGMNKTMSQLSSNSKRTENFHCVKARGGNHWEISDIDIEGKRRSLQRTFLNNEPICKLRVSEKSNRSSISAFILVKKGDTDVEILDAHGIEKFFGMSRNKEKILKALTEKALQGISGKDYISDRFMVLGVVELTYEKP